MRILFFKIRKRVEVLREEKRKWRKREREKIKRKIRKCCYH